jgi:magnesium transporter
VTEDEHHIPAEATASAACLHNADLTDIGIHLESGKFFWLDLEDPSEAKLRRIGDKLKLHPLTIDDARQFNERAKIEDYENYVYMVVYGVEEAKGTHDPTLHEVHLVISGDWVVTIHRGPLQALKDIRQRYHDQPIRSEQFLIYKILDEVTSTFFPILARIDDDIDEIEQEIIVKPTDSELQRIFSMKRDLVTMRRAVTPMRDVFARNADRIAELPGMTGDDRLYFRDIYDTLIRVSDTVDSYRDILSGATDMYLSTVANRQGEVAKQLTIIATIFLPLSFITGFFGQNFSFLVLHIINNTWSFFVLGIGLLVASTVGFIIFFQRKGWIGS